MKKNTKKHKETTRITVVGI